MKLYTEEQVRKAIDMARDRDMEYTKYGIFDELTPIELPSDEEIRVHTQFATNDFYLGAKWMKEQIVGKEDKTFKKKSQWTRVDNMTRRLK